MMKNDVKSSNYNIYFYDEGKPYVYNTYTGALSRFEKEKSLFKNLKDNRFSNVSEEQIGSLFKQGFVVKSEMNELNRIKQKELETINSARDVAMFVVAPTLKCNFNCVYCFEKNKNMLTENNDIENDIFNFIVKEAELKHFKTIIVSWFGGEPLLKFKLILSLSRRIKEYATKNKIEFYSKIVTNGSFFTKDKILSLISNGNLRHAQITLDGDVEIYCKQKGVESGVFDLVLKNIAEASTLIKVSVRLNCSEGSYNSIKCMIRHFLTKYENVLKKKNINFYLAKITNYEMSGQDCSFPYKFFEEKKDFKKFLDLNNLNKRNNEKRLIWRPRKTFCGLRCLNSYIIGPDGALYKCEHDIGDSSRAVGDIWNGYFYNDYYMKLVNREISGDCTKCKLIPICMGGCFANGSLFKKGHECVITEPILIENIREFLGNTTQKDTPPTTNG